MPTPEVLKQREDAIARQAQNALAQQQKLKERDAAAAASRKAADERKAAVYAQRAAETMAAYNARRPAASTPVQPKVQAAAPTPTPTPTPVASTPAPAPSTPAPASSTPAPAGGRQQWAMSQNGPVQSTLPEGAVFKKGGKVNSASRRGDGIAQRGKTKGRYL